MTNVSKLHKSCCLDFFTVTVQASAQERKEGSVQWNNIYRGDDFYARELNAQEKKLQRLNEQMCHEKFQTEDDCGDNEYELIYRKNSTTRLKAVV